jgi:hypothetical protein
MTEDELTELEELRAFKRAHSSSELEKAFYKLELLLDMPYSVKSDGVMSVRATRIIGECLLEIKKELCK